MSSLQLSRHLLRTSLPPSSPRLSTLVPQRRHASNTNNASPNKLNKSRLLEKPTRFNPPSHPARIPARRARPAFQVPLSAKEKEQQKKKQYPHMMPPEGTFLHWFLTNRVIHVWITMSILISLAFFTWLSNFLHNTPYLDELPPNNLFLAHPLTFVSRYVEVYRMHTEFISAQTAERRRNKVEDVRKRAEYRKAHGMDGQEGIFGGWTAREDREVMGVGAKEKDDDEEDMSPIAKEGGERRTVKKWLGIW